MSQKIIFILWALLYLGFGIGLLIIPNEFMSLFGSPLDIQGQLIGRVFGSALLALSMLFFFSRTLSIDEVAVRLLVIFSLMFNGLDAPIMAIATLNGVMNSLGWIPVSVNLFIALSALYLLNKQRKHDLEQYSN